LPSEEEDLQIIRFGEFLVERRVINREQLLRALMVHHVHGIRIGAVIARLGYCSSGELEQHANEYHAMAPARPRQRARR
jgi:hypothetical protein